jgi:hypothetical protein
MYNTYYTNNLVKNGSFEEIGGDVVQNGKFEQIGGEEVDNGSFSEIGNEEVTGFTNGTTYPFTTFTTSDNNITSAIVSSGFAGAVSNAISVTSGEIYKVTFDYTKNSGDDLRVLISSVATGAGASISNIEQVSASGTYTKYFKITSTTTGYLQMGTGNSGHSLNASISNISVKEVGQHWTFGTGWSISDGLAINSGTGANSWLYQSKSYLSGKTYKISADVNLTSGSVRLGFNSVLSDFITTTGSATYTYYLTLGSNQTFAGAKTGGSFSGSVDNITVKEVGQDWSLLNGSSINTDLATVVANGAISSTATNWGLYQSNVFSPSKSYRIKFRARQTNGSGNFNVGYSWGYILDEVITSSFVDYCIYFTTTSNGWENALTFGGLTIGDTFEVDNIVVQEVGQNWTVVGSDANNYVVLDGSTARLKFLNTSPVTQLIAQGLTLTSGTTYKLIVDVASVTSGSIKIDVAGISEIFDTSGVTTRIVTPTSTTSSVSFYRASADVDITLNSVTLQELKHQATNLLVNSGDYQSANPLLTSTKSMNFDGIDDYLQLSEPISYTNHTICGWAYSGVTNANNMIFSASDTSSDGIRLVYRSSSNFRYEVNGVNIDTAADTREANRWYFVCGTYDGTTARLYIDGVELANATTSETISTTTNARIGSVSYAESALFDGKITEVGAYNRALTSLEVASLYNQGVPTDLLVNRNNYQSGNPVLFNTKQVNFDGVDDKLVANYVGDFTGSISAWVNRDSNSGYQFIIDARSNSGTGWIYFAIGSNVLASSDGTIYVDGILDNSAPTDGNWHHVVVTGITLDITESIVFGSGNDTTDHCFDGKMSQVGLWNTTLTADEVSSLYNHGLPIDLMTDQAAYESSSNLVGYWRMGSGTNDGFPVISDQLSPSLDHISTTNLVTYSEDFTQWSKTGTTDVSPNDNISPDGTQNASTVSGLTGSGSNDLYLITGGNPASKSYSFSVYLKGSGTLRLQISNNVNQGIGLNVTLTSDWKRHIVTGTFNSTSGTLSATLDDNGATATQYNIWGAQLEEHPIATPYVKSNGIPGQRKSSTTNTLTYSEDFNEWTIDGNSSITSNATTSPTGTSNATKLIAGSSSGRQAIKLNNASVGDLTVSVFAKKGEYSVIQLTDARSGSVFINFDLENGSLGSSNVMIGKIENLGNDWYRCSATYNSAFDIIAFRISIAESSTSTRLQTFSGNDSDGLYIWGAQLEQQTQATPYIKTNGSPVTVEFYKENNYAEMVNLGGGDNFARGIQNGSPYANTLQYPNDFSQYSTGGSTPPTLTTGQLAPDGTLTATKVSGVIGSSSLYTSAESSVTATRSIYARTVSGTGTASLMSYHSNTNNTFTITEEWQRFELTGSIATGGANFYAIDFRDNSTTLSELIIWGANSQEPNTGLQGYWKMGDGTNDEYPIIYDQTNPTLSSELVTNGDFATDSDWIYGDGWNIEDGFAKCNGTQTGNSIFYQNLGDLSNKTVKFTFTISNFGGGELETSFFGASGTTVFEVTANGDYTFYVNVHSGHNGNTGFTANSSFIGYVDNVSVKEVQGNPAYMTSMVEGNITNQYPLTKLRNYYRMGDGILDSKFLSYPTNPNTDAPYIFQDQTSPNLAHIPTTNLITYSEDITLSNGYSVNNATISSNQGISPIGDNNATKLTATTNDPFLSNVVNTTNKTFTLSVYAKGVGSSVGKDIQFILVRDSYLEAKISDSFVLTDDWVRYEATLTLTGTPSSFVIFRIDAPSVAVAGDEVLVWGCQFEEQSQATAYIKSDGVAAVRKSSTTNLIEYSEDFSNASWLKLNSTVDPNTSVSLDGTLNADEFIPNNTTANIFIYNEATFNASHYTLSFFIKYNGRQYVQLLFGSNVSFDFANFDLINHTVTSGNGNIEDYGNDWYRISLTSNVSAGTSEVYLWSIDSATSSRASASTGNGANGYYVYGAQLEEQTQAETYAPTKGIPVTIDLFKENNYGHTQGGVIQKDVPRNS